MIFFKLYVNNKVYINLIYEALGENQLTLGETTL